MSKASRDSSITARFEFFNYRERLSVVSHKSDKKTRIFGYSIGDTIKGNFTLDVLEAQPIDFIRLQVMGILWHKKKHIDPDLASIIIINSDHRRAVRCFWHEEYILEATKILNYQKTMGANNPFDSQGNLKKQVHTFPFECKLKNANDPHMLAPTYEDAHVKIIYAAFATIERPESGKAIYVMQILKVNTPPSLEGELMQQVSFNQTKIAQFSKVGSLNAQVSIPKLSWQPSSSIPIHCLMDNDTNLNVQSIEVALIRESLYNGIDNVSATRREVILYQKEQCMICSGRKHTEFVFTFKLSLNTKSMYVLPFEKDSKKQRESQSSVALSQDSVSSKSVSESQDLLSKNPLAGFETSHYTQLKVGKALKVTHQLLLSINLGPTSYLEDQFKKEEQELRDKSTQKRRTSIFKAAAAAVTAVTRASSRARDKNLNILFNADLVFYDKLMPIKDHSVVKERAADSGQALEHMAEAPKVPSVKLNGISQPASTNSSNNLDAKENKAKSILVPKPSLLGAIRATPVVSSSAASLPNAADQDKCPPYTTVAIKSSSGIVSSNSSIPRHRLQVPESVANAESEADLESLNFPVNNIDVEVVDERVITTPAYEL